MSRLPKQLSTKTGEAQCHRFSPQRCGRRALSPGSIGSCSEAPCSAPGGGGAYLSSCRPPYRRPALFLFPPSAPGGADLLRAPIGVGLLSAPGGATELGGEGFGTRRELQCAQVAQGLRERLTPPLPSPARSLQVLCALSNGRITKVTQQELRSLARRSAGS